MQATTLDTSEDLRWLKETHGIDTDGYVLAVIEGHEDCPRRVMLYAVNDYRCVPRVWTRSGVDGELIEQPNSATPPHQTPGA